MSGDPGVAASSLSSPEYAEDIDLQCHGFKCGMVLRCRGYVDSTFSEALHRPADEEGCKDMTIDKVI